MTFDEDGRCNPLLLDKEKEYGGNECNLEKKGVVKYEMWYSIQSYYVTYLLMDFF